MEENRTVEMYVANAIEDALKCQSIKYRNGDYISERYYRKIMKEVQKQQYKIKSKEIPDYLKGKFIELPDDLKKKHGGVVAILFLDD